MRRPRGALAAVEPEPVAAGDEKYHDRPGQGETGGLAREATDDLGPSAHLLERALQAGSSTAASFGAGADRQGWTVRAARSSAKARRRARVLARQLADEGPQAGLGSGRRRRVAGAPPNRRPGPALKAGPPGQLGQDVAEPTDRAALAAGIGPQLAQSPGSARVLRLRRR